jgi:hypothetical protein
VVDLVRYDNDGKRNYYRLKHPREIRQVLAALFRLVEAASKVAPPPLAIMSLSRFRNYENMGVRFERRYRPSLFLKFVMGLGRSCP